MSDQTIEVIIDSTLKPEPTWPPTWPLDFGQTLQVSFVFGFTNNVNFRFTDSIL